jgi:hypothetical protein
VATLPAARPLGMSRQSQIAGDFYTNPAFATVTSSCSSLLLSADCRHHQGFRRRFATSDCGTAPPGSWPWRTRPRPAPQSSSLAPAAAQVPLPRPQHSRPRTQHYALQFARRDAEIRSKRPSTGKFDRIAVNSLLGK